MKWTNYLRKAGRYIVRSQRPTYYSEADRYMSLLVSTDSIIALYKRYKNTPHLRSMREIGSQRSITMGMSKSEVHSLMGMPKHRVKARSKDDPEVLFFRKRIGKYHARIGLYFFDRKLFFYNYNITIHGNEDMLDILQVLAQKYTPELAIVKTSDVIADEHGHCVSLESNGVLCRLNYLHLNSPVFDKLSQMRKEEEMEQLQEGVDMYGKLYKNL